MIISRYISKEIIINICWVSLVLFGLVLFSRFNIFLSQAEVGKISPENIFIALLLFSPELLNLVFPLSVFLATGFVLTPIFKSHFTIFDSGSFGSLRLVWSQKWLILGIFLISIFLSTFLAPYFTSKAEDLIDKDKLGEPYIRTADQKNITKYGLGLGTFIGKTLLEKNFAKINFYNSSQTGGAEVSIIWKNKDLNSI